MHWDSPHKVHTSGHEKVLAFSRVNCYSMSLNITNNVGEIYYFIKSLKKRLVLALYV